MLFWLKKTLTIPLLPFNFALLLGTSGVLLLWSKRFNRLGRILVSVSIFWLLVFANKGVALALIRPLESKFPAIPEVTAQSPVSIELQDCVAVVVLGGGHGASDQLSSLNQLVPAALSRLSEGVRLARIVPSSKLITCGHHTPGATHARVLADAAISLGIDPARIVLFEKARDTEDEITAVAQFSQGRPVAIVTSAWHMPRTLRLCEKLKVNAVPCPTDFSSKPGADIGLDLLAWDLPALDKSSRAIREYVGILWLAVRGK